MDTPGLALVAPAGHVAGERAAPEDSHARWRYELERAQAQLRAPAVSGGAAPARTLAVGAGAPRGVSAVPDAPGAARSALGRGGAPRPVASEPAVGAAAFPPAKATLRASGPLVGPGATRLVETSSVQAGPAARAAASPGLPPALPWPSVNAHLAVRGGLATVWIRDAGLAPEALARLEREVRSRLRALGAELEALFVNGRRVEPIGAPQDPLQNPTGGQDGN